MTAVCVAYLDSLLNLLGESISVSITTKTIKAAPTRIEYVNIRSGSSLTYKFNVCVFVCLLAMSAYQRRKSCDAYKAVKFVVDSAQRDDTDEKYIAAARQS